MALDRLIEGIRRTGNPTVAGLDPLPEYIPPQLRARYSDDASAVLAFNCALIDALCDIVPAVKPQAAFYERLGWQGMRALAETIQYARGRGLFVIIDAKRGDIGSTMEAYAAAHLGAHAPFAGDALTVNPYLGSDGITPLLKRCAETDTGIFVLVKTSNPSSGELQDRLIDGAPVYRRVGEMCEEWGRLLPGAQCYSGVGAVVGATYPAQLTELRAALPHTFFLVPGYGAQGGGGAAVRGAFDEQGGGAVVNSSRALMCAWQKENAPEDFAGAARREALRMKEDIA